jgi:DNA topoisomerase VI subunit A
MQTKGKKWTIVEDYLIESIDSSLYSIKIISIEAFQTKDKWYKKISLLLHREKQVELSTFISFDLNKLKTYMLIYLFG